MTLAQQLHRSATHKPGLDRQIARYAPQWCQASPKRTRRVSVIRMRASSALSISHRDFSRHESDNKPNDRARAAAYYAGLERGLVVTRQYGLDMHCGVRWDNPGFHTPEVERRPRSSLPNFRIGQ